MVIKDFFLSLSKHFLSDRCQRVVLNSQTFDWKSILAGVPQGSILGPLLFLIFVNDLPNGLKSIVKIFSDDTSLFSPVNDLTINSRVLNNDLVKISNCAHQWKMSFNPDPKKQAVEVFFSRKQTPSVLPKLTFNRRICFSRRVHETSWTYSG